MRIEWGNELADIRVQNTKNNLTAALLTCIEHKSIHELKVKDIIQTASVSTRTFYQYYSDVSCLVKDTEDSFIEDYLKSVEKDRKLLADIDLNIPFQEQLETILNSTKNTIEFCFERKREIQLLLSDNGDIRFYNLIFKTGCDEFLKRMSQVADVRNLKMTEKERITMMINVQVFVHSMIGVVRVLLDNSDRLSPYDVRQNILGFLREAPISKMNIKEISNGND